MLFKSMGLVFNLLKIEQLDAVELDFISYQSHLWFLTLEKICP